MKKVHLFTLLFTAITLFYGCKKDNTTGGGGNNTLPDPYLNLSNGNIWNYQNIDSTVTPPTITNFSLTAGGADTTVNGMVFKRLTSSRGGSEFYNNTGADYYTLFNLPAPIGTVTSLYLKDNVNAGTTWEGVNTSFDFDAGSLGIPGVPGMVPVTVKIINTIMEKGISRSVNNVTYTNVIHVKSTISVTSTNLIFNAFLATQQPTTDIKNYYAPRYGSIESRNVISSSAIGLDVKSKRILLSKNF